MLSTNLMLQITFCIKGDVIVLINIKILSKF
jgi:hypothetical protein